MCVKVYGFLHKICENVKTGVRAHRRRSVMSISVLFQGMILYVIAGIECPGSAGINVCKPLMSPSLHPKVWCPYSPTHPNMKSAVTNVLPFIRSGRKN